MKLGIEPERLSISSVHQHRLADKICISIEMHVYGNARIDVTELLRQIVLGKSPRKCQRKESLRF